MRLETFATHVGFIMSQSVGNKFTCYVGADVRIHFDIRSESSVYVDGVNEGNRQGAIQAYARKCSEVMELQPIV